MNKRVLYFSAPWCGPCKMLSPIVDELTAVYRDVEFIKINIDDDSELAKKHSVRAVPTLLSLDGDTEVGRIVGVGPNQVEIAEGLKL